MATQRKKIEEAGGKVFPLEVLVGEETLSYFHPDMRYLKIEDLLPSILLPNKKNSKQVLLDKKNTLYKRELSRFAYLLNDISRVVLQDTKYKVAVENHDGKVMRKKVISTIKETSTKIISKCYSGTKSSATKHKLKQLVKKFYSVHKKNSNEAVLFEYGLLRTLFLQRNQKRRVSGEPSIIHSVNAALSYLNLVEEYIKARNYSDQSAKNVRKNLLSTQMLTSIIAHDSTEDYSSKVKKELGIRLIDFSDKKDKPRIDLQTKEIYLNWEDAKIFQNKLGLKILERFSELSTKKIISLLVKGDQEIVQNYFDIAHSANNFLSTIYSSINQVRIGFFRRQKNFSFEKASFLGRLSAGLVKLVESDDNENTLEPSHIQVLKKYFLNKFYKRKIEGKSTIGTSLLYSERSSSSEVKMQRFLKDYLSRRVVLERTKPQLEELKATKSFDPTILSLHAVLDLSLYATFVYSQNALTNAINAFKQEMVLDGDIPKSFLKNLLRVMHESKETGLYNQINSLKEDSNHFELGENSLNQEINLETFMRTNSSLSAVLGYMNDTKISLDRFALFKNREGKFEQAVPYSEKLKALSTIFYFGLFGALERNAQTAHSSLLDLGYSNLPRIKTTEDQLYLD